MKICLTLLFSVLFFLTTDAHEIPPRTIWELKQNEIKRIKIKNAGVRIMIRWKQVFSENAKDTLRHKNLDYHYDANGNLIGLKLFVVDTLAMEVRYTFNEQNQLLTDEDYDSRGKLTQIIRYTYDEQGLALEGKMYDADNVLIGVTKYVRDNHSM